MVNVQDAYLTEMIISVVYNQPEMPNKTNIPVSKIAKQHGT